MLWQMFEFPPRVQEAAAYAMPLLLVTVFLFWLQYRIIARKGYVALTGKGGERRLVRLGPWRFILLGYCLFVTSLSFFLPMLLVSRLFVGASAASVVAPVAAVQLHSRGHAASVHVVDDARAAMTAVEEYLVRRGQELVLLFTPPFDKSNLDPGYIKGYVPGVRENGGQYTHAAAWVVMAALTMLMPLRKSTTGLPSSTPVVKVAPQATTRNPTASSAAAATPSSASTTALTGVSRRP